MGIMVYSLLWILQDFVHQPYVKVLLGFGRLPCILVAVPVVLTGFRV